MFGEHKFGGNAQSITKQRWVHHTSFLWDFQPAHMEYLQHPPRMPDYRQARALPRYTRVTQLAHVSAQGRPHTDFICRLRDRWPRRSMLGDRVAAQLLRTGFRVQEVPLAAAEDILRRPHHSGTTLVDIASGQDMAAA